MVQLNHSFEHGDKIKVIYEVFEYHPSGRPKGPAERKDVGKIVSKPSRQFDWPDDDFDFDYELERGTAIRSVDIDVEQLCQLYYDEGGDRDWKAWKLVSVERIN